MRLPIVGMYVWPGFFGSLFLAFGSIGVGWFPLSAGALDWPIINFLQTNSLGQALARSLVVVGAALILQAWLIVGIDALHNKIADLKVLYTAMGFWCAPLIFTPPLFSRDVFSYYMQGKLQLAGYNPYDSGVALVAGWFQSGVDPLWGEAPTPYGPAFLFIEKVVAYVSGNSALLGAFLFRLIAVAGVAALTVAIPFLARQHGISDVSALWLGAMNPLVIMHFVAGAHNDSLMVALVVVALVFALKHRWVVAALLATAALAIKPVAIVILPFLAYISAESSWLSRIRQGMRIGMVSVVSLFAMSYFAGVGPLGWLNALSTPGTVKSWLSPFTAIGLFTGAFADLLGFGNNVDQYVELTRQIGSVVMAIILMYLVLKPEGRSATRGAAFAFASLVIFGPVVQPWYLLWAIPLVAASGLSHRYVRVTVIVISAFTIHGIANSSATTDTFMDLSDGLAIVLAAIILAAAVFASPHERQLIIGDKSEHGIKPETPEQLAVHEKMIIR
ncbi:MAG: hypothetical protein RLZZ571_321 [Actinomycetota bacterium]